MSDPIFGISITRVDDQPLPAVTTDMSIVGLVFTAPAADATVFPLNTPVLFYSDDTATVAKMGLTGTDPNAVELINDQLGDFQVSATIVGVRVQEGASSTETIANLRGDLGRTCGRAQCRIENIQRRTNLGLYIDAICPAYNHAAARAGPIEEANEESVLDISYMTAAGAGALSFLSPCVLPLVPPYLCYMAGVSVEDFRAEKAAGASARRQLALAAIGFVLGFTTVFVLLGAGASSVGAFLRAWQQEIAVAAGFVIILMGLNFLGILRLSLLSREARFQARNAPASPLGAYVMGLAFAFGWTPCIGPVLGPILTLAGGRETVGAGAALLAVYSLGLGIPFLIAALFSGAFMRFLSHFRVHLSKVEKAMGALLVVAGVLFLTGGMQSFSFWLLEAFPVLGRLG